MPFSDTVYLDFAATAAVRPEVVIEAVTSYLRDVGATPGRAGHRRSLSAGRVAFRCRRALADLFAIPGDPGRISFQLNATHALNIALQGLLRPGDRVVRTAYDHNSVRRVVSLLRARGVTETVVSGRADGGTDLDELEHALAGAGEPARVLVVSHGSNVLGTLLPLAEMAERAHAAGAVVVVDASQTAGHAPVDADALGVDLLAFAGHKGLLGPQGTGGLWVREGIELPPLLAGGTGSDSWSEWMPESMPDRLEAGTQNAPGIAGLLAGVEWLRGQGIPSLHTQTMRLKARLRDGLAAIPGVRVHSPPAPGGVAIVTITVDGVDPARLALRLDREHGVLVRAGLHCAPETHALLGTAERGAVRFSPGWATTEHDVDRAVAAVAAIAGCPPEETTAGPQGS